MGYSAGKPPQSLMWAPPFPAAVAGGRGASTEQGILGPPRMAEDRERDVGAIAGETELHLTPARGVARTG